VQHGGFQYREAGRAGFDRGLDTGRELIGRSHLTNFETLAAGLSHYRGDRVPGLSFHYRGAAAVEDRRGRWRAASISYRRQAGFGGAFGKLSRSTG
jgi:hypothetical protein